MQFNGLETDAGFAASQEAARHLGSMHPCLYNDSNSIIGGNRGHNSHVVTFIPA